MGGPVSTNSKPALILIALGIILLIFNFLPGVTSTSGWWLLFIFLSIGFFVPALVWPEARSSLSALFIPGTVMGVLGLIFMYNVLTNDWGSWAYLWTLIPGSAGAGMFIAAKMGDWEPGAARVGQWLAIFSTVAFILFSSSTVKIVGAVILITIGILMLSKSGGFRRTSKDISPRGAEDE